LALGQFGLLLFDGDHELQLLIFELGPAAAQCGRFLLEAGEFLRVADATAVETVLILFQLARHRGRVQVEDAQLDSELGQSVLGLGDSLTRPDEVPVISQALLHSQQPLVVLIPFAIDKLQLV
jgi:hypothetical protein